ncbi:MAG: dephospho-CoA kinase [Crocinitomicaceae bacterium]
MIVGITGGIGSGKSVVGDILNVLSYPVFNSDVEAKNILQSDAEVKESVIAKFGDDSFLGDLPNRPYIAEKVFTNKENLEFLNGLIHPAVQRKFESWIKEHSESKILFKEAAILIESGAYKKVDKLILVTADEEIRIQRVMKRDGVSKEKVLERMKNQLPDVDKMKLADYVIHNDGSESVIKQVIHILKELNENL